MLSAGGNGGEVVLFTEIPEASRSRAFESPVPGECMGEAA